MAENQNQEGSMRKSKKSKLNKSHIQGFISGILLTAILASIGFIIFSPTGHNNSNLQGTLQGNQYVTIQDFDKEVLKAPGQTLVYINDSSLSLDRLVTIYDNIYENYKFVTKTYNYSKYEYGFLERLGLNYDSLPCFAMFENGKLKDFYTLDLKGRSVLQWLAPFNSPRIYRAFPSSAFDSVGIEYKSDYYISELCLLPDKPSLENFIRLSGNMTLPINQNSTLYSLLGGKFGGDNKTNFGLPNLDAQIPATGLRYFMAYRGFFPMRDYNLTSYVDGNIKYLEFRIDDLNYNSYIGQILLAKNVDEAKYKEVMLPCDGRELSINQYPILYSIVGDRFGGDGITRFKLPDLTNAPSPISGAKYYIMLRHIYPASGF